PYAFFFAGLFLAAALGLGLAAAAAAGFFTGACLFTAVFLPLAASFTGAGVSAPGAAGAFAAPPLLFAPALPNLPPFRPHLPRSGAAASKALHSSKVRLLGSLSFGI